MFAENWPRKGSLSELGSTFSILLPAFGSILSGSTSSLTLKRPQYSIPVGTLQSFIVGTLIFIVTTLTLTACSPSDDLLDTWRSAILKSSIWFPLTFAATNAASVGKAITGLNSGPNLLRFMAKDQLIPEIFGKYALYINWAIVIMLSLWGDLSAISSICGMMLLCIFVYLNYFIYVAYRAKIPSFMPMCRIYNPYISLLNSIVIFICMFFIDWVTALIWWCVVLTAYCYVHFSKFYQNWGSLTDSVCYNKALMMAIQLKKVPPLAKLYRPNILAVFDNEISKHANSIRFLHRMIRGKGMGIVARHFYSGTTLKEAIAYRNFCIEKSNEKDLFFEAVVADSKFEALRKLMILTGLGNLRPNIVFLEFDESFSSEEYKYINTILQENWSLIILRNPMRISNFGQVDFWWLYDDGGMSLLIASMIAGNHRPLRVLTLVDNGVPAYSFDTANFKNIKHMLKAYRINAEVVEIEVSGLEPSDYIRSVWADISGVDFEKQFENSKKYMILADVVYGFSSKSDIILMNLFRIKNDVSDQQYMRMLALVSAVDIPFMFIHGNGIRTLTWDL